MTLITLQDGSIVLHDGKVGTEQACCCEQGCCEFVTWHRVHGACNDLADDYVVVATNDECYAEYTWEDWDCQNPLVGRDCGAGDQCNIYARVKVTGNTAGTIEYLQSTSPDVWGTSFPGGFCDCPNSAGSLSVACGDNRPCCVERWTSDNPGDPCPAGYTFLNTTPAGLTNCYKQTRIESAEECSLDGSFTPNPPATGVYSWGVEPCYENPLP